MTVICECCRCGEEVIVSVDTSEGIFDATGELCRDCLTAERDREHAIERAIQRDRDMAAWAASDE
jgi:hypothetical protein